MESMRLRCHAHNQYEAEQAFGREFMRRKREQAKARKTEAPAQGRFDRDTLAGLRQLGVRADIAQRALEHAKRQPATTLEEFMKAALQFLWPKGVQRGAIAVA